MLLFDGPVLLAGSDSPDLPIAWLTRFCSALQETDVATIPCRDGGYVAIGLRRPTTELFAGIPWSTSGFCRPPGKPAVELGLSYHETDAGMIWMKLTICGSWRPALPGRKRRGICLPNCKIGYSNVNGKPVDLPTGLPDNQEMNTGWSAALVSLASCKRKENSLGFGA